MIPSFPQQLELSALKLKAKGGFFSENAIYFLDLQISKKNIPKKNILNLKSKIPAQSSNMLWAEILNFKFKIVFLEYFFSRFGDLKNGAPKK